MRFALMTEPQQGLSYAEILALARTTEDAGLEAFFRSDHYGSFPNDAASPTTDAWTTPSTTSSRASSAVAERFNWASASTPQQTWRCKTNWH